MTTSSLVKIDLDGNRVDATEHRINETGFVIHYAIHMSAEAESQVVMHTHTRAGMAVAA